jgi:hypothetical protein
MDETLMRRILINNAISRRIRRSQRGQSIVLLAFAFIALIAFVGLVTDIALLFVRYAALRRAVDSAAIAAAGQVRESTTYAEVAVAAQQYIELHGLESDSILVETCETDIHKWRMGQAPFVKADGSPDPHPEADFKVVSKNMPETELCDWDDPRKLVRVSAQIKSPTTFLSLIGIKSITLESTSVSETAVIDIALVIDTSESMSKETNGTDLTRVGLLSGSNPDGSGPPGSKYWPARCTTSNTTGTENFGWGGCCNDIGTGYVGDGRKQSNNLIVENGLIWHDTNGNGMWDGNYENGVSSNTPQTNPNFGNHPAYVFDSQKESDPASINFTTLVCNPFKQVKDAARAFVRQLDFVRGDRIVFVTFDRNAQAYTPTTAGGEELRPLIRDEQTAITTLNRYVGILYNNYGAFNKCQDLIVAGPAWDLWLADPSTPQPKRPFSYETVAPCTQTNIGGGILTANNALTDPVDVRREAVWVMVLLTDGAANATSRVTGINDDRTYGYYGYCPWWTFCRLDEPYNTNPYPGAPWPECVDNNPVDLDEPNLPYCNDDDPYTRHFCLSWETGEQVLTNPECGAGGHYDADDYARDMADFAGLIEVEDDVPGNYIAMFSIGFGLEVVNEPTGAPLLRYIADAGDNGVIDNNLQQDWRDDAYLSYGNTGPWPPAFGDQDPCYTFALQPTEQCGQYYFAQNLETLTDVFEEIAGRLFTRLSR